MDVSTDLQAGTAHSSPHIILDQITETTATPAAMTHTTDKDTTGTTIETWDTNITQDTKGTNPSRLKEEQKHLQKKPLQHHNPPTHNLAPKGIPPMPQQRLPLRTPPRPAPMTWRRKPHLTLLSTLKVTSRQEKFG